MSSGLQDGLGLLLCLLLVLRSVQPVGSDHGARFVHYPNASMMHHHPRVLVVVVTTEHNHHHVKCSADTYYRSVLRFHMSNASDPRIPTVGYPDQRVRDRATAHAGEKRVPAGVLHANSTYGGQFDWMLIGDDDTYFVLSNLVPLLGCLPHTSALFIGNAIATPGRNEPLEAVLHKCDKQHVDSIMVESGTEVELYTTPPWSVTA